MKKFIILLMTVMTVIIFSMGIVVADSGWVDDGTVVRLNTSTDSVGIGTSSPNATLHVAGNILLDNGGNDNKISGGIGGAGSINFRDNAVGGMTFNSPERYQFQISGVTGMVMDSSRKVGIGTNAPGAKLDVNGTGMFKSISGITNVWFSYNDGARDYGVYQWQSAGTAPVNYFQNNVGIGVTNPSQKLDVSGNIVASGTICDSGGTNCIRSGIGGPNGRSDYRIYKDTDGSYKAVRMSDGVITHSNATDAAAVINGLLSSLALVYSPSNPNPNFTEGRRVVMGQGLFNIAQTIVIPPTQDFIFEADKSIINSALSNSDIIRIDSSMNSRFILPLIAMSNTGNNTAVRIKPQNTGPDDIIVFTTNELYIEAVVGDMNGLTLDASLGGIEFLRGEIKELNLYGTNSPKRGIYIPTPGAGKAVRGNELKVLRVNAASEVANVVDNSLVFKNSFWINNADAEGIALNIPLTNNNAIFSSSNYLQVGRVSAAAPASADCDSDVERGRLVVMTNSNRLYVCNGATRGWDYVALTN